MSSKFEVYDSKLSGSPTLFLIAECGYRREFDGFCVRRNSVGKLIAEIAIPAFAGAAIGNKTQSIKCYW